MSGHVLVVGAGLSGLSAAMHLRGRGHRVTVLERDTMPGGRYGTLRRDGFRFDTGPVVFTMVDLLQEAFTAIGQRVEAHVTLRQLDPAYHAFFADGSSLRVLAGHEAMRAEIATECGAKDAAAFDSFVKWLRTLNDLELPHFIDTNYSSPLSLLRTPVAAARLLGLGAFERLGPAIERRFEDERLRRVFSFQAMYAGLAPRQALALYAVITYMDSIKGVWFPDGGMHAVPMAMAAAATEAGIDICYESEVGRVVHDGRGARGVELVDGSTVMADAVVVTADLPTAYRTLLPELTPPRVVRRGRYSPSALVWHLGVKGELPAGHGHHNIHFGHAWDAAFDDLLRRGRPMADPSRYVAVPSVSDPGAAPAGHHTLYLLEPVPNLKVGPLNWTEEGPRLRERALAALHQWGYPTDIVTEELVTPADWERAGMAAGTPFALAHTFGQTGPFRPANVDRRMPGLVFAGSGTVPGVGIPMVLISGKLAAQRVDEVLR